MNGESLNLTEDLIAQLQAIVPAAFSEGKLDVEKLKTLIGEETLNKGERYELNWPGKADAYKVLQRPTTETLVPTPEDSINWNETENVFIEGENLAVLKVLQKSYYGKIKMIYIDPPYNTGSDSFIYPDKFSETKEEYAQRVGDKDDEGYMMKEGMFRKNSKDSGHYHSNWLNMMLPRLHLARNLLTEDGIIFVSIDDNEQANLKLLMDQIFGEENFVGNLIWKRRQTTDSRNINMFSTDHEYILVYGRSEKAVFRGAEIDMSKYKNPDNDPRGPWASIDLSGLANKDQRPNLHYELINPETNVAYPPNPNRGWSKSPTTMNLLIKEKRILWPSKDSGRPREKKFLSDINNRFTGFSSVLRSNEVGYTTDGTRAVTGLFDQKIFDFPKSVKLLSTLVKQINKEGIVLDFFSGSGSLGHAVLDLNEEDGGNRKFICVQLPEKTDEKSEAYKAGYETISAIAEARIKKVIEQIEQERSGKLALDNRQVLGFRKFTLQDSNFKVWRGDVEDVEILKQQMQLFVTPEKEGSLTENILWELLVKNGKLLTENLTPHEVEGGVVWSIEDGSIAFALDIWNASVTNKLLELRPQRVIALDSVFEQDDAKKSNAQLQCEDAGIAFTTV